MTQRTVLVTGASRGIGRAVTRRLRKDGYRAIGVARSAPADLDDGEEFVTCDLSDAAETRALIESVTRETPLYGLVNNAAMSPTTSLDDTTLDDMDIAQRVNVIAPLLLAQGAVPGMRALGGGRIVNLGSRAALGKVNRTAYSATKSAIVGMTRTWALELAGDAITANVIAPGPIDTELFRTASPPDDPRTIALKAAVPLGRVGSPDEIAHVVAFLLDDLGGFITGQTIHVDGGLTISAVKS
jgi:3-oxoacyl-[acyl-carrier protein] reductase